MNRQGFTLVELMIVVAIIGVLAAIAIPNFVQLQLRSKRSEVPPNVDGIKMAQLGYDAAFDTYIECLGSPSASPSGKSPAGWVDQGGFSALGWAPNGDVRGAYVVTVSASASGQPGGDFLATGECDVDGDSMLAQYTATKSINTTFNSLSTVY
jgi:type IV pilus assembly protein PilA